MADPLSACAYLFDNSADGVPEPQLAFFTGRVLQALSVADPEGKTRAQLRVGLPMLPELATRTTSVRGQARSGGRTVSHDVDTYKFVIWDWLDSLTDGWSTVDPDRGSDIFRLHTGECVMLSALGDGARDKIDEQLRDTPGYIGGFVIDPGNLVHRRAFGDLLSYVAAVEGGAIIQELSWEGDRDWPVEGSEDFKPGGADWRPFGWLAESGPPFIPVAAPSLRGLRSATALKRKHAGQVEHRVIDAITERLGFERPSRDYDFRATGSVSDLLQAIMPDGKFTHYLFSPDHKDGSAKAGFFVRTLGIAPEDWRFLAAQFYEGLLLADPEDLELKDWGSGYGMQFNAYMRVRGRSGQTAAVRTHWMMHPRGLPSLIGAVPADRDRVAVEPAPPPILHPGARSDADWATLWTWASAAGRRALEETVPTPLFLHDLPPEPEGEIGSGAVRLEDARHDFATWIEHQEIGDRERRDGVVIYSPNETLSLERGVAWARAVAQVFVLNGIEATAESHPD